MAVHLGWNVCRFGTPRGGNNVGGWNFQGTLEGTCGKASGETGKPRGAGTVPLASLGGMNGVGLFLDSPLPTSTLQRFTSGREVPSAVQPFQDSPKVYCVHDSDFSLERRCRPGPPSLRHGIHCAEQASSFVLGSSSAPQFRAMTSAKQLATWEAIVRPSVANPPDTVEFSKVCVAVLESIVLLGVRQEPRWGPGSEKPKKQLCVEPSSAPSRPHYAILLAGRRKRTTPPNG